MGRRWNRIKTAIATAIYGVPTNYGQGYLTSGTAITYRRGADGIVRIDTPATLQGCEVQRLSDGTWSLV